MVPIELSYNGKAQDGLWHVKDFTALNKNCVFIPYTGYGLFAEIFSQGCIVKFAIDVVPAYFPEENRKSLSRGVVMKYVSIVPHETVIMCYLFVSDRADFGRTTRKLMSYIPAPTLLKLHQEGKVTVVNNIEDIAKLELDEKGFQKVILQDTQVPDTVKNA